MIKDILNPTKYVDKFLVVSNCVILFYIVLLSFSIIMSYDDIIIINIRKYFIFAKIYTKYFTK